MGRLEPVINEVSAPIGVTPNVTLVLGCILLVLILGSIVRMTHLRALPADTARSLLRRLRTWWIIALVLIVVVVAGRVAVTLLMTVVSLLALREYLALVPHQGLDRSVVAWAYVAVPINYLWVYLGWYELFLTFIPVWVLLAITARLALAGHPEGYVRGLGALAWGMMALVFALAHAAQLAVLPDDSNPAGGAIGWFVYLVVLTELNDIAQAIWGRAIGRHQVIRSVSPGKTWEGLAGGVVTTVAVGVLIAPLLTPIGVRSPAGLDEFGGVLASPLLWSAALALVIAVTGFLGDIAMSAVKRDCHVKESGSLLPGQGGILDRVDSLTFTAPVTFHLVRAIYL